MAVGLWACRTHVVGDEGWEGTVDPRVDEGNGMRMEEGNGMRMEEGCWG